MTKIQFVGSPLPTMLRPQVAPQNPQAVAGASLARDALVKALSYDPVSGEFRWLTAGTQKSRVVGEIAGRVRDDGYRVITLRLPGVAQKIHLAQRLAWLCVKGEWPLLEIDHRDRDRDNNAISNLREVTRSYNQANSPHRGFRPVLNRKKNKIRYRASICINYRDIHLGYFDTPEEARRAYEAAHVRAFGEFSIFSRHDEVSPFAVKSGETAAPDGLTTDIPGTDVGAAERSLVVLLVSLPRGKQDAHRGKAGHQGKHQHTRINVDPFRRGYIG